MNLFMTLKEAKRLLKKKLEERKGVVGRTLFYKIQGEINFLQKAIASEEKKRRRKKKGGKK